MTSTLTQQDTTAQQDRRQVEILGMIGTRDASESRPGSGPAIDPVYTRRFARAHEEAGFDRILIGYGSSWPEGTQVAAHVAAHTERLGLLVAHRPGFVAPTLAARTFATLDQFSGGRVARAHHHRRQRRRAAPRRRLPRPRRALRPHRRVPHHPAPRLDVVRARSTSRAGTTASRTTRPACCRTATATCRCSSAARRRRRTGSAASTPTRSCCGASRWPRPPSRSRRCGPPPRPPAGRRRGSACRSARSSRRPRSSPGSGRTGSSTGSRTAPGRRSSQEAQADRTAHGRRTRARGGCSRAAEKGDLHDRALWTPTATAAGAGGNTTALVGSPETVAAAILDYVEIGVDTVLIRGYDPLDDAVDYGRYVIPLVRQELAGRGR